LAEISLGLSQTSSSQSSFFGRSTVMPNASPRYGEIAYRYVVSPSVFGGSVPQHLQVLKKLQSFGRIALTKINYV